MPCQQPPSPWFACVSSPSKRDALCYERRTRISLSWFGGRVSLSNRQDLDLLAVYTDPVISARNLRMMGDLNACISVT